MRAAAAKHGTAGECYQKLARESTGQIWLSTAQPSTLEETPRQFFGDGINRVERVERERFLTTDDTDLHGWIWWNFVLTYF